MPFSAEEIKRRGGMHGKATMASSTWRRRALRVHGIDRPRGPQDSVGSGVSAQDPAVVENPILEGTAPRGLGCVGRVDAFGGGWESGKRSGISQLSKMVGGTEISPGETGRNTLALSI